MSAIRAPESPPVAAEQPENEAVMAAESLSAAAVETAAVEPVTAEVNPSPPAGEGSADSVVADESQAEAQSQRAAAAEQIRKSASLPPYLRERLAAIVESSGALVDGKARVPIDEAIRAVEESLPDFLHRGGKRGEAVEHPAGDSFFSGDPSDLSDAQAEEVARQQLTRSGLLRGQRVRVAD